MTVSTRLLLSANYLSTLLTMYSSLSKDLYHICGAAPPVTSPRSDKKLNAKFPAEYSGISVTTPKILLIFLYIENKF